MYKRYKKTDSVAVKATLYTAMVLIGLSAIIALIVVTRGAFLAIVAVLFTVGMIICFIWCATYSHLKDNDERR